MKNAGSDKDIYPELACEPRRVRWIWLVYLLLYAVAIPWYWPKGYQGPLVSGFPLWVVVSLGSMLLLAIWTAWVIHRFWRSSGEGID